MNVAWMIIGLIAAAAGPKRITQEELVRRTQELADAVGRGDAAPWKKYYASDALYFDEKGRNLDKAALVKDIAPLPQGFSGSIKVVRPQCRIFGNVAVLSYDMDESETIFGQQLRARYHATDTWMFRNGAWQILATQVLRYYEDPSVGSSDPKAETYVGTYELAPGVTIDVSREGDRLFAQRSGREREELLPEANGIFFRKGVEGRRLFRFASDGKVDALIDRRNNEDVIWKKVR